MMPAQREHPVRQMIAILALAFGAAVVSNALAGRSRHLAWRLPPPPPPLAPRAVPSAARTPAPEAARTPETKAPAPLPPHSGGQKTMPAAPTLQSRFPVPADGAPVDTDGPTALELLRLGARFIDARRTADFEAGHIRGARSIPMWEDGLEMRLQDLDAATKDPNDPLVIYCSGGGCRDSHELAQKLWLMGFRNLRIYTGGWPEWSARGWSSATGPEARR